MRQRPRFRTYPPIVCHRQRRVRFQEVDQLAYMWHGHYPSWLEDGREALGKKYGISYLDFYHNGVVTPLKSLEMEYCHPLRYDTIYTIETSLLWNDAAVIEYSYRILDDKNTCMTTAHSLQLMLDVHGTLLLDAPAFYKAFMKRWAEGLVQ
ncbi:MAG: acyl-CoA thioesterase [Desulfovibrio sp.]|nr:acyl-CoA thioesterase [Desulfovibrio sp.]